MVPKGILSTVCFLEQADLHTNQKATSSSFAGRTIKNNHLHKLQNPIKITISRWVLPGYQIDIFGRISFHAQKLLQSFNICGCTPEQGLDEQDWIDLIIQTPVQRIGRKF
jgi:hypothetical protein